MKHLRQFFLILFFTQSCCLTCSSTKPLSTSSSTSSLATALSTFEDDESLRFQREINALKIENSETYRKIDEKIRVHNDLIKSIRETITRQNALNKANNWQVIKLGAIAGALAGTLVGTLVGFISARLLKSKN